MSWIRRQMEEEALASNCRGESEDLFNMEQKKNESLSDWRIRMIKEIDDELKGIDHEPF